MSGSHAMEDETYLAEGVGEMREDPGMFINIARVDWLVSKKWNRLHAVLTWSEEDRESMAVEWAVNHPVRLACGRTAGSVCIPGMFTRMGALRCRDCCKATGLPPGKGSPKNDDACRELLGLERKQDGNSRDSTGSTSGS
jgi:hypothetical protein